MKLEKERKRILILLFMIIWEINLFYIGGVELVIIGLLSFMFGFGLSKIVIHFKK